jgi:dipeptidyl aminopeptidase/acylaminoacyl peptidase
MMRDVPAVRANVVAYKSGDLKINAWLYEPPAKKGAGAKNHPIDRRAPSGLALVVGHGGIWGIPAHYDAVLRRLAAAGWTIAAPSFRGEDGSEGEVEFALGEADDMIACWKALADLPKVDPSRTWFLGSSHGAMAGLIAMSKETMPREAPGVIAGWGVYDVGGWLDWMGVVDHPMLSEPYFQAMRTMDDDSLEMRSAISMTDNIRGAILLLHGRSDTMVPIEQSEKMADAMAESGNEAAIRFEPGADHEYIWGPERKDATNSWTAIMDFIETSYGRKKSTEVGNEKLA